MSGGNEVGNLQPRVVIIVLNYNGYEDTLECIQSVNKINYYNYKIIIVDNGSTDFSVDKLLSLKSENTEVILNSDNLGYAAGNNIGIKAAIAEGADYICVLNNDVVVHEDFLSTLVSYMEQNPTVGVCSPVICDYENREKVQSSGCKINYWTGETPFYNNKSMVSEVEGKIIPCDYVGGACMLFRTQIIEEVGEIPEIYFLFYEETEWCSRIKKKGFEVVCNCSARIFHKGSASIGKIHGLKEHYMCRNRVLFVRRNSNKIQRSFFRIYIVAAMLINAVIKGEWKRIGYYIEGLKYKSEKASCII